MAEPSRSLESLDEAIAGYVSTVDGLYGLYLDCILGFRTLAEKMGQIQQQASGTESSTLFMGRGSPDDPGRVVQHRTTLGDFKRRNAEGGPNWIRLAQLLIVLVYEYWEYRARVASALGLAKATDLKSNLMGDLRLLRIDVIHHQAVLRAETVRKLKVLHGFQPGDYSPSAIMT